MGGWEHGEQSAHGACDAGRAHSPCAHTTHQRRRASHWTSHATPSTAPRPTRSCDVLNWLGGLWLAVLVVGCCGVPLALAAFWWVGRMDRLERRG